jgi:hypothetical protein
MGEAGLRQLPAVGKSIASQIAGWLEEEDFSPDLISSLTAKTHT